jgi:hypothetical protein
LAFVLPSTLGGCALLIVLSELRQLVSDIGLLGNTRVPAGVVSHWIDWELRLLEDHASSAIPLIGHEQSILEAWHVPLRAYS